MRAGERCGDLLLQYPPEAEEQGRGDAKRENHSSRPFPATL